MAATTEDTVAEKAKPAPDLEKIPRFVRPLVPKTRWEDMPRRKKAGNALWGLLQIAATIWVLWDIRHRSPDELRGTRRVWTMVAFIQPFGPILYFFFGRKRK